ncbi:hypothetical protein E2C01_035318 [Portunus trituberculatus]|uniref:Uncharacterized protein n=1 Tax=Portunus trituberculatus TaxID=210409 RepID=A0A5B7F858_PORTR|nr:hypothetical protein [Portunus trituberculatus]
MCVQDPLQPRDCQGLVMAAAFNIIFDKIMHSGPPRRNMLLSGPVNTHPNNGGGDYSIHTVVTDSLIPPPPLRVFWRA